MLGSEEFLSGHRGIAPQPLLEQLLPALCGDRVLHLVICGPKEDPAIGRDRMSLDLWGASPNGIYICL